jgi:hypothetical protein
MASYDNISYSFDRIGQHLKFNIIYLNINSLKNKLHEIELIIEKYKRRGIVLHFIALTEVRLDDDYSYYYNLSNYKSFFCNKVKNSGGVALYVRDSLSCSPVFHASIANVDMLCVSIASLNIKICVIYKQPTVSFASFLPIIDCFLEKYRNCILVGDINIDLLKPNADSSRFVNNILSNGYYLLNKINACMATRIGMRNGIVTKTIIDHIITDVTHFKFHLNIQPISISDHNCLLLSFDTNANCLYDNNHLSYTTHKTDFNRFRNLILNNPYVCDNLPNSDNIDNCINFLKTQYIACTSLKVVRRPNENKPWITAHLLNLIAERDRFYSLHKKFPNNIFASEQHKHYKSSAEICRKSLRTRYFANLITKNMYNAKKLWSTFNFILFNKKKEATNIASIKNIHNENLHDDCRIANELNNYFSNVGSVLANRIREEHNYTNLEPTLLRYTQNSMFITNLSYSNVEQAIISLKPNASNNDEITANIIKKNMDILVPILTNVINSSFSIGNFPDTLKIARLIPLFKSGDPTLSSNYRPISILPAISKITEKVLFNITANFVYKFKIINKHQFGFQKRSGSLSATSHLITNLQKSLDNPKYKLASGIFIDLQKAFDSIPHEILLDKLCKYGIRGLPLEIFKSYLSNRRQYVSLRNINSDTENITYGTPQGSNLGPLIFLLYINDIFDLPLKGTIILFADDAVIYYSHFNVNEIYNDMQHDLNLIYSWLYNNLLSINISKTKYMIFHSDKKTIVDNHSLHIHNQEIERVNSIKYLGLHIQSNLKWNTHIETISKKIAPLSGILYRLNRCAAPHLLRSIYFAHIHSKLSYLSPVWGSSSTQYLIEELQILQNKAIRNIFYHDYYIQKLHTNEILTKYKIFNVSQLIQYDTTVFFYKIYNNLVKHNFTITRGTDVHSYPTRNRTDIYITRSNTNYGMFNVYYSGARQFNGLNEHIRNAPSLNIFKQRLKNHIMSSSPLS